MNIEFEKFLVEAKEKFCRWRCTYNKGSYIKCDECGEQLYETLCDSCPLDDYIAEIRDENIMEEVL